MVLDAAAPRRIRTNGRNPATTREFSSSWLPWNGRSHTGMTVTNEKALGLTAAYRGVTLIASLIASLPIDIYEKRAGQRVDVAGPSNSTLWARPNPEMTRQTFWEAVVGQEVLGNGFIFVDKDSDPVNPDLWPLEAERVRVGRLKNGTKVYEVDNELPMVDYRAGGEIIHIPNWSKNGLVGYNPFTVGAESLAIGLSAQEYAARFYSQADAPPGYLTSDQVLTEAQAEQIGNRWNRLRAGLGRAHRAAVLGGGAKFLTTGFDPESSQLYEARKFGVVEVARLLGLPPHLLADVERSTSWGAGIEEQNNGLLVYTVSAHITRHEQAVDDDLLVREVSGRFMKFNLGALQRTNMLQRYQAYRLATFMTENEKRAKEDLPPMDGGDQLLAMTNLAPIDKLDEIAMSGGGSGGAGGIDNGGGAP
jgi:HK97 family phage portal protein